MSPVRFSPLGHYRVGAGSWFASHGIQNVMFAWLVTMVLRESPQMVGIAQMALLIPATLLMLVGGSLADSHGGRRIAVIAQSIAVLPPLALMMALSRKIAAANASLRGGEWNRKAFQGTQLAGKTLGVIGHPRGN